MARFPGALWKPITVNKGRQRLTVTNRVNLHVAVSEAQSLQPYFNQRGIADSHFYVRKSGVVEQMVDTAWRANADLDGNDATISIETQGGLHNANTEKWTAAQLKTLADIFAWAVKTHGIEPKLATDSKLGASSKGLSWHRLGVNGNFPRTGILRGRKQRGGGMHYSTSYGKTCPGDEKIKQIPGILKAAVALEVSGGGQSVPTPSKPKPKPSKPKPKPKHRKPKLAKDGSWGPALTRALQAQLGTTQDGVISGQIIGHWNEAVHTLQRGKGGSNVIRAMQTKLGVTRDGLLGPNTIKALQRRYKTRADGVISGPRSSVVVALQKRLNKGKF